ncbi:MAG: hypothetical protein DI603_15290 [Roseateles depolymerans]|uniref:Lipoprotein n=1 Tax=Roseateles depolymerans TaxID=76731 RepID=A0A2W5DHU5_9BURK|nr:MAG: hypothetical protein DI603_15290 [Roseateles depolymerans]
MKRVSTLALSLMTAAALVACGGGSDDSGSSPSNGGASSGGSTGGSSGSGSSGGGSGSGSGNSGSTPVTAALASSICGGSATTNSFFDVVYPGVAGIARRSSRAVGVHGQASDAQQCLAMAGSTAQNDLNQLGIVTTDAWANNIGYFEWVINGLGNLAATNQVSGAIKLNQQLFIACSTNSDAIKYLGVKSSTLVNTDIFGTKEAATVARGTGFTSMECQSDGKGGYQVGTGTTVATFAADGSLTVTEGGKTALSVATANVPALFSDDGYTVNGTTFRWGLYQVPVGTGSKQVIVHTTKKADGSYGVLAFVQP